MARRAPELVNPVPAEEIPAWLSAMTSTFLRNPESGRIAQQAAAYVPRWEPARAWGARDRGRWVATLRTVPQLMTVPSTGATTEEMAVDTVTNVTVAATHTRRGVMTAMLDGALRCARERGDAASILIAAEWPIYSRFGYAPATAAADYTLRSSRAGARLSGDLDRVRQVDRAEFATLAPAVFAASRRLRAGQIDRSQAWWDRHLGLAGNPEPDDVAHNFVIREGHDGPDGWLGWTADGNWSLIPPYGSARVSELAFTTAEAYRDLWSYLCGLDLIDEIHLRYRPVDEPVQWLLADGRTLVRTGQVDHVWLRLLDLPAALRARRYAMPGELVLEVVDEAVGAYAAGRYRLAAGDGDTACDPTSAAADVTLDQRVLASIYLGGFRLHEHLVAGGVREHTSGALARLSAMFATALAPWDATWF